MAKLQLLCSGPGTGKTTYCIDLFRKAILESPSGLDSRAFFVLPNREHVGRIQNLALKKEIPGLFNVHILTLQDLASRFSSMVTLPRPGESLRLSLLRRILEDPEASWSYFSEVKTMSGFHALLSERIQEFVTARLDVDEFERRAQPLLKDPVFRAKFRDFSLLMKRYSAELEKRGLAEAPVVEEETAPSEKDATLVILDGFYHFDQSQKALIRRLTGSTQRMVVTLTLPKDAEKRPQVYGIVSNTRRFLLDAGFKEGPETFPKNHRMNEPALAHLEQNLFSATPKVFADTQNAVRLLEAQTPREEVERIAQEILAFHRETPWHFSDMAVILRSAQGYEKLIAPVFEEYGIPVYVHERRKMIQTGLGRFTHRFAGLILDGWQQADLFVILKSLYCPSAPDPDEVARYERTSYAKNISSDRDRWILLAKDSGCDAVGHVLRFLAEAESLIMTSGSARVFRLRFLEWIGRCQLNRESAEDAASQRALEDILARSDRPSVGDREGFSPREALEELRRSLEVGLFSQRPLGKNRVQVYDVVMAIPKEYRVVFIAGLLDQMFPKTITEDPLFKDEERLKLNGADPRLELRSSRHAGERYYFYMAVTRTRDRLVLSYPKKDQDARALLPSSFVADVRACFSVLPSATAEEAPWVARAQAERALAQLLFSPKNEVKPGRSVLSNAFALCSAWRENPRFSGILETGLRPFGAAFRDPRIVAEIASRPPVFSATRLETFLTCAFKYFADQEMRLKPAIEDRLRLEMGILMHTVLELHYKAVAAGKKIDPQKKLEELFAEGPLAGEPLYRQGFLIRRLRRTLKSFLIREAEELKARPLVPTHFEMEFGKKTDGSPAPWPYLRFGRDEVLLGGKIDRIDVEPDGDKALVIDYKLGSRNLKKKIQQGVEVQLPVYMLAVQRLLGLGILGAELRFLESGKKAAIDEESAPSLLEQTEPRIVEAAARIRRGDISVRSKSCDFCEFDSLCRFQKWKLIYAEADRV